MIKKQERKNLKKKHKMCKIHVKMDIYYAIICKHENYMTRLWCNIMLKLDVEKIEINEGSYSYLYSFGDLTQESFQGGFYVCIK